MFKLYNRLKTIELKRDFVNTELRQTLISRESYRDFSEKPITKDELAEILYFSAGIVRVKDNDLSQSRRAYPSAGAKYPLEIYPLVLHGKGLERGLYHYNVIEHSLDILLQPIENYDIQNIWMSQKYFKKASIIIIITALPKRITAKYGSKGLGYALIEAGHLAQNVSLLAHTLNIGCSAVGEFREKEVIDLLDLNPDNEIPIYYLALGN